MLKHRIAAVGVGLAAVAAAGAGTPPAAGVAAAPVPPVFAGPTPLAVADFDGDGRDDLAIGVPRESVGALTSAGALHVVYGSPDGLSAQRSQLWTQASPGVPGRAESDDAFGWATAAGDFDGDGFDDLAIGVPLEGYEFEKPTSAGCCIRMSSFGAGALNVLYGSSSGLRAARAQVFHQGTPGVKGQPERGNYMGAALAAGDFDGDGRDDLAVGAPGENTGAGAVHVLRGTTAGLRAAGDQLWLQDTQDVDDASEKGDGFGSALAAGNLGYSTRADDLAIGIPGEDLDVADAGAVAILYGQPGKGLSATLVPDRFLHQNVPAVDDSSEKRDMFGSALAIGDFGRTAQGDLAVGIPGEGLAEPRQGAVQVFYGTSYGVGLDDEQLWHQGDGRLKGVPRPAAEVGRSLVAANFNGVSQADLAIGAPYSGLLGMYDTTQGAGNVHVVYGGPAGLSVSGSTALASQIWNQATLPPVDQLLTRELFGFSLAAGAFRGTAAGVDLAVAAPNAWSGKGFVQVVRGGPVGLVAVGSHVRWHQDVPGIADEGESGDRFGGG